MMIPSVRRTVRPNIESLEDRCTPTGTVTGSLANGVWRLTGDSAANAISVTSAGPPGAFTVTGDATAVAGVINAKGVHKIVFDMKGDNDQVTVDVARLTSMTFHGGDGDNTFRVQRVNLAQGLQIINGVGYDVTALYNFRIGSHVNVNNGSGGSTIYIATLTTAAGFNKIGGSFTVHNGAGADFTTLIDTDVGGSVTVHNGEGGGQTAGTFRIYNSRQTTRQAVVGGHVTATFQNGDIVAWNGIWDTVVRGNVVFNNGSGAANTYFDGFVTNSRVYIGGSLMIAGTGTNLVSFGRQYKNTGLRVVKNLIIDVKNPTDLDLQAFRLFVDGQTRIV